jgi:hypothetical protein
MNPPPSKIMSDKDRFLRLHSQEQPFLVFEDDSADDDARVEHSRFSNPSLHRKFGASTITIVNIATLLCTITLVSWIHYHSSHTSSRNYHMRQTNNFCVSLPSSLSRYQ